MSAKADTYDELMKLAKTYHVEDNALFVSAAEQYALQQKVIANIQKALDEEESLMTTKEYVKGRMNVYANPLVKELPKNSDSANKTLGIMLDIILKLGHKDSQPVSRLEQLANE